MTSFFFESTCNVLSEDSCVCTSLFHLLATDGWAKVATRFRNCHSGAEHSASLYTELNLRARVLGKIEKDSFITLPGSGGHSGLMPSKPRIPTWKIEVL